MVEDGVATSSIPIPLWIDADPSGFYQTGLDCDDDLAIIIAIALHQRQVINLEGLSICGGNAPLKHTWNNAKTLWKYVNGYQRTGILNPMKGYGWNSMQVGVKLLHYYNMLFPDDDDSDDAVTAILEQVQKHNAKPMTILSLGPPSNIAKAIERRSIHSDNDIGDNIEHIYLMGGELTNQQLDLNFRSDRDSARIVIDADIPKTIIPIQTCGQIAITDEWISSLNCDQQHHTKSSNKKMLAVCAYTSKMNQQVRLMPRFVNRAVKDRMILEGEGTTRKYGWKPSPNLNRGFIPWDIVALLAISHSNEFDQWMYHRVSIPKCSTNGEPCDGTMKVIEDLNDDYFLFDNNNGVNKSNWSGIVRTPHKVRNETRLLEIMLDLISDIEVPSSSPLLKEQWGYIWYQSVSGFSIATAMFVICCIRLWFR